MKQCLGRAFLRLIRYLIICAALAGALTIALADTALAVTTTAPDITVTDGLGGTTTITWPNTVGTGAVTYEVYRKASTDAVAFASPPTNPNHMIANNISNAAPPAGRRFVDTIGPDTGLDKIKDGVSWDATNLRWGCTYQIVVVARDAFDGLTNTDTPNAATAEVGVTWCDNMPPNLSALTQGPADGSVKKAEAIEVRVGSQYVDWGLGTPATAVFTLHYTVNGGATTDVPMSIFGAQNPGPLGAVTTLRATMDLSAAPHGAVIAYWVTAQDQVGNTLTSSLAPKAMNSQASAITFTIDKNGPTISSAQYLDFGTPGINAGDQIILTFSENIQPRFGHLNDPPAQTALSGTTFELGRGSGAGFTVDPAGTFGTGASVSPGPLDTQVTIQLGTDPVIRFVVPGGTNLINAINYRSASGNAIRDDALNSANTTAGAYAINGYEIKQSELPTSPRPFMNQAALFTDFNGSGVIDAGDRMRLYFNKAVVVRNAPGNADFATPVTDDHLYVSGGNIVVGTNTQVDLTLGSNSFFTVGGTYSPGTLGAKSPSGVDVSTVITSITDEFGNNAQQIPNGNGGPGIDIIPASTTGPALATVDAAVYDETADVNGVRDGLSAGDTLTLTFDKPVTLGTGFSATNAFLLTNGTDNLDTPNNPPTFPANNKMVLTFSSAPSMTVYGIYGTNPGASGIDISNAITLYSLVDVYGNTARPITSRDVTSGDLIGASISNAGTPVVFIDNGTSGPNAGDFIEITFNKPIVLVGALASTDFQLNNLNFGTTPTFTAIDAGVNNRKLRITLGGTGINVNASSQLDVLAGTTKIQSWRGVGAVATSLRTVNSSSGIGPKIVTAQYTDSNNDFIGAGDSIVLTFDKQISCDANSQTQIAANPANVFRLLVGGNPNGSLGGAGFAVNTTGLANNQLRILLGANPTFVVRGTYGNPADPNASGIDIVATGTPWIEDVMRNGAATNTPNAGIDIGASDTTRPTIVSAVFKDVPAGNPAVMNGISANDELTLTFSKAVTTDASLNANSFYLPVNGDSLATFTPVLQPWVPVPALLPTQIRLVFQTVPTFRIAGIYNGTITPGSSSAIDVSTTNPVPIYDAYGNVATSLGGIANCRDMVGDDTINPTITAAVFVDVTGDGVTAGDLIYVGFSRPLLITQGSVQATQFTLGNGGNLGTSPTFKAFSNANNNNTLEITLGGTGIALQFNPPSASNSTINVNGGPLGSISDVYGNGAVSGAAVNIVPSTSAAGGPYITSAVYTDSGTDGVSQGDILLVTFNKDIVVNNPTSANFSLPANNGTDTLGTNPTFDKPANNQVRITLGASPKLTIVGTYTVPAGKSSGININAAAPNPAAIKDTLDQNAVAAANPVDITGTVLPGPIIVSAVWADVDNSGTVSATDTFEITFDKAIVIPLPAPPPPTALTRAIFNLPVSGDYFDFTTYTQSGTNSVTFTLNASARFTVPGVYNNTNTAGSPSGINIVTGTLPADCLTDVVGNLARPATAFVDITPKDAANPTLVSAVYNDTNLSNLVDAGDKLILTFTKPILLNNPVRTNFNVVNGNIGNNPTFNQTGVNNTQMVIMLDTGAALTFLGNSTSSIDIGTSPNGTITTITDASGNPAKNSTPPTKYITVQSGGQGPLISTVKWIDNAPTGVLNQGDALDVTFDRDLVLNNPLVTDFMLPVAGDTLGVGVNVAPGATSRQILITLGANPYFTVGGVFNPASLNANSPSGLDVSTLGTTSGRITDIFGYNARQKTPSPGIDIAPVTTTGPNIQTAIYWDVDTNGVSVGDYVILTFNEQITAPVGLAAINSSHFSVLPTASAPTLGANPTFEWFGTAPTQLFVKLGTAPNLTIKGTYPTTPGATGIDVSGNLTTITNIAGNGAHQNNPVGVDIGPYETVPPTVVGCRYVDVDGSKTVTQGDRLYVVFSETLLLVNPLATDFRVPVTDDTLGGGATCGVGSTNKEVMITLGSAPKLTPAGYFANTSLASGAPSGIDVRLVTPPDAVNSITDIYGNPATASIPVDIDDGVGPSIVSAVFTDVTNNGVDTDDVIVLTFTEPITFLNVTASDFALPVSQDTLGANPTFTAGTANTQLKITLGGAPAITVWGTYNPANISVGSPSGINISTLLQPGHITDMAGNNAIPSNPVVDITGSDNARPHLIDAMLIDVNDDGVSQGDLLGLLFDKAMVYRGYQPGDYDLPVTGDTLGLSPSLNISTTNSRILVITLGSSPKLTVPGTYNANNKTAGSPSGIDMNINNTATNDIIDVYGNPAEPFGAAKDIRGSDDTGPVLVSAVYYDPDGNGVDKDDVVGLVFDKTVQLTGNINPGEFTLPVQSDSFGVGATYSAGTTSSDLRVTLGLNPTLTIDGVFTSAVIIAGSPSGVGCTGIAGAITDTSGNRPQATTPVDIISASTAGPQLLLARIDDVDGGLSVTAGDRMVLSFNKPVKIVTPPGLTVSDFTLPVNGDSLGAGATFEVNPLNSTEIYIGLGAGVTLRPDGTFANGAVTAGSPSGIGFRAGTGAVRDLIGNAVVGGTVVDIADTFRPFVMSVRYEDVGNNGLNQGDRLYVRFSKTVNAVTADSNDFALSEATDTLGELPSVIQSDTDTVMITVGRNPSFKIAGVYPTDAGSSGLDLSNLFNQDHIKDAAGNSARRTVYKDIYSTDTTRPRITAARYGDANNNGIVDGGDTLSITFSKSMVINGVDRSDFNLVNGSFGTGGVATATLTGTNEITFVLGANPTIITEGVFPGDPNASAIDLAAGFVSSHLTDFLGNVPTSVGFIDITETGGPVINAAIFYDVDGNGVSSGDQIRVQFSRRIVVNNATPTAFTLPVNGDSLGTSPSITQSGSTEITITLGAMPQMTIAGTFLPGNLASGSPSGININGTTSTITDLSGNPARSLPTATDISPSDFTPPTLISAVFKDLDNNGVSQNDTVTLTYSKNIMLSSRTSLADFVIVNGSLGDGPKFNYGANNREVVVTLGSTPLLSLFGPQQSQIGRHPSTYISGHIMDVSGNDWRADAPVPIVSNDRTAPQMIGVKFVDADNLGITAGDRLEITFNKPIIINSAQPTDFVLPVSGDSVGLGASVVSMTDPTMAAIVLGTGANFTVRGTFSPGRVSPGSASGLNLARTLTTITSIAGVGAQPLAVAADITSDDNKPPVFVSAESQGTYGKNLIKARGDSIVITALLDDPSLRASDITADLRPFGLGSAVAAQSYINNVATWAAITTPDVRGTIEIVLNAIDIAGNVGTYGLFISVIMPVEKCVAEILPGTVLRKSGAREFSMLLKPSFRSYDTGMNKIVIAVPHGATADDKGNFRNIDISASKVVVNGRYSSVRFNGVPNGGEAVVTYAQATSEITVLLGEKVNQNTTVPTVEVTFRATVPDYEDEPFGKTFGVTVDDTNDPAQVTATGGDVNGKIGDSDGLKVTTTGVKISYVTDKVVITPSFWKVIFSVKFNADMNAEKPPKVTFRPTYTLQNEQQLTLMSFVDGLYMGYAVVPFEAFGFNGEYVLKVYDAQDYMGNDVNTLTLQQRFSPKFLIAAYMNPLDEKTLVIHTKYIQSSSTINLTANPTVRVWQDGTNETLLTNVTPVARPNVYKGYYTIDPNFAGNAQIEVEGHVTPDNALVNGKSVAEFTSAFIKSATGGTVTSSDKTMSIAVPKNAFERDVMVVVTPDFTNISRMIDSEEKIPKMHSLSSDSELKSLNRVYQIYPDGLAAKAPIEVFCDVRDVDTAELRHAGLFALDAATGAWEFVSSEIRDGGFAAKTAKLSSLAVLRDETPPVINVPKELADRVIADKFDVDLTDRGAGVDPEKIKATISGRLMKTEYDRRSGKLTMHLPPRTIGGIHSVSIEATDRLGNTLSMPNLQVQAQGYFDVVNYVAYPNPARNRVNINYTLGRTVSEMSVRIYDMNGDPVYDFGELAPNFLTVGKHDTPAWLLRNDDGDLVGNGVYYYKITARDPNGDKLEKYGKIAVLK